MFCLVDLTCTIKRYLPNIKGQKRLLEIGTLFLTCILSISIRMFSVVRYESVIHEFDPYFNYRSTQYLTKNGVYDFINYFDATSWYPLGRAVGPTIYPGLMMTAATIYKLFNFLSFPIPIKDICVFVSPLFAAFTVIASYLIAEEGGLPGSGLFAGWLIAVVPAYISRSVAGSYDNEAVAIFAMILTYYLWVRTVRTGRMIDATLTALAYFYMVSAWGGYVFIINLIPIHVLVLLVYRGFSERLYIAYSIFYCVGTLLSMQIPFVGFQPVQSSEHLGSMGVFGLLQIIGGYRYVKQRLGHEKIYAVTKKIVGFIIGIGLISIVGLISLGVISPWTGRFHSLLDPSYAKNNIPIIASVAEHQPTSWSSLYNDFFTLLHGFPLGMYYCIYTDDENTLVARVFLLTYVMISLYFSSLMVRLVLVLAPGMAITTAVGISRLCHSLFANDALKSTKGALSIDRNRFQSILIVGLFTMLASYCRHCILVSDNVYSSPSIVLTSHTSSGTLILLDDFRESYWWLRQNTANDAKIMSWWDYGYQISAIANRTTIVDNNTWNNTHISRVGQAMSRPEAQAVPIMRELDVDYVLILFGGFVGFSGDDISKSLWMIKIGASTELGKDIDEKDYFSSDGQYHIDTNAGKALKDSLLYRMCYYRFDEVSIDRNRPNGFDRVRNEEVGVKNIKFDNLEEVFTSKNWIVRIYKFNKDGNRQVDDANSR